MTNLFESVLIFSSIIIITITFKTIASFLGIPWDEYSTYYYWLYALTLFYYVLPEIQTFD
jgi:hypothetical protein